MAPVVTVGIPVFNGEPYLAETIESVLAQDLQDFVLVISDNGSTDGTEAICRQFAARDSRIAYHRNERNRGAAWNYNRLVELADSPYFRWQAADDVIRPSFLSECVRVLEASPDVVLCYAAAEYVNADGTHRRVMRNPAGYGESVSARQRVRSLLATTTHCFEVFGVIRHEQLAKTRLIGAYPASDLVLLAELSLLGRFAQVPEPLFVHRMHRNRSVFQHEDRRDLVRWYVPDARRIAAPRWRLLVEYFDAFRSLPVPWTGRAAAIAALVPWAFRHRLQLGYDLAACLPQPIAMQAQQARDRRRERRARARVVARGDRT